MLQQNKSSRIAAFVVWVPQLNAELENVGPATAHVPDGRARHFWDPQDITGRMFQRALQMPVPAWDVYLLYRAGPQWSGADPPRPDFWMQQLGGIKNAPRLDAGVFSARAADLLNGGT